MRKIEQFLLKNNILQIMMDTHIFATIAFTYLIILPGLYSFIENELIALVVQYVCNFIIVLALYIIVCKFVYKDYNEKLIKRRKVLGEISTLYFSEFVIEMIILLVFKFINSDILNKYGVDIFNSSESTMDKIFESNKGIEFLIVVILAPICEELVFRGVGLTILKKHGKDMAVIFTAILFGLCHGNLVQSIAATISGIILGYVCLEFGLFYSIILHMLNNFIVTVGSENDIFIYGILFIGIFFFNENIFDVFNRMFDIKKFNIKVLIAELLNPMTIILLIIGISSIIENIIVS